jgi:hypothetical protein
MNIYGSLGYTILNNNNHNIIIFADMHDTLKSCNDNIIISDWMKDKFNSSYILLEEVERIDDMKLGELWSTSKHTQELKKLYLNNPTKIIPVDIRPFLIPFSWEINKDADMTLYNYLIMIDNFFCIEDLHLSKKLKYYNKKLILVKTLGKHFLAMKHIFYNFIIKYNKYLYLKLNEINDDILVQINELLDFIMEWFICSNINSLLDKSIILHAGLAHSQNIIVLLNKIYNYNIVYQNGVNYIDDVDENNINGCVKILNKYTQLFG